MVSEREEGVVAFHLPFGPLNTHSGLEPNSDDIATAQSGPVKRCFIRQKQYTKTKSSTAPIVY